MLLRGGRLAVGSEVPAEVRFADSVYTLSSDDTEELRGIFAGKRLYRDNPSCGFDENASVKFGDSQTFCIAKDTCPIVYWKEKDEYIKLGEDEKTQLYDLLKPFGFSFPCV